MSSAKEPAKKFAFGKNWQSYLKEQNLELSLERARQSLIAFLGQDNLAGKTFLDVGCGSGIHSLAALSLGATVVSVDVDTDSVACARSLQETHEARDRWTIKAGSMLDESFMKSLGSFDIVYCWGVAHHTGNMWHALGNLVWPLKPGGELFVAIYNTVEGRLGSRYWQRVKKFYVSSPRFVQLILEWGYWLMHVLKIMLRLSNPVTVMRRYRNKRGMSYRHDLIDWLGGFPYEHARAEELFDFYFRQYDLVLTNLKTTNFIGNNQLLFKKPK